MKNHFLISDEEKNRIRNLHESYKVIKEQVKDTSYKKVDKINLPTELFRRLFISTKSLYE